MSTNTPVGTAARPLRVAVVGSGPAGVYAADILTKSEAVKSGELTVSIDLFDRYPAPYGLIRYGVAPDHPRIKGIVNALHKVLDRGDIRFFGNVDYGTDLSIEDLRTHYDAVIFATGAIKDADLNIPGIELEGSYGGADFVSWYDGHPDVSREWPLEAKEIAVIGNGNVALDVARMLSKHADDLLVSEIPDNVYAGLKASPVTDVHVFGRRGPAQVKFTPLELRELSHSKDVDIILYAEDFEFDAESDRQIQSNNQTKTMVGTLTNWIAEQPEDLSELTASRRLHLHFLHSPVEVYDDAETPAASPASSSSAPSWTAPATPAAPASSSTTRSRPSTARSATSAPPLPEVEFDHSKGVVPNDGGRVLDASGSPRAGHLRHRLDQARPGGPDRPHQGRRPGDRDLPAGGPRQPAAGRGARRRRRRRTAGKPRRAVHQLGRLAGPGRARAVPRREGQRRRRTAGVQRERIKVVPREDMVDISRGGVAAEV